MPVAETCNRRANSKDPGSRIFLSFQAIPRLLASETNHPQTETMTTPSPSQVWGSHLSRPPIEQNVQFCAGRDVRAVPMADEVLLPYDLWTNRAHSIMLHQQGLIADEQLSRILAGLLELERLHESGKFYLDPEKEDVHINVEAFVTETQGADAGGRMHIGRSRNDQSSCDVRLWLRDQGLSLSASCHQLSEALLDQAERYTDAVMPGFTHYQPAMITTWGHWLCAYVQGLVRDLERMRLTLQLVNRNPLGAAASFGTSWPIDRKLTAELLAFDRVDTNTLDCIVSRWEHEAQLAHTAAMLMNHLSIIAQDLIILSLPYTGMVTIDEAFVTGSSIMPQKKNPDFAEVLKSKASLAHGYLVSLLGIQKGGFSGYNRDTQATKYLIMDLLRECEEAPGVLRGVFETLTVNRERMREQCRAGFMNSVDWADHLARTHNLPFRECYHVLAVAVRLSAPETEITQQALEQALQESGHDITLSLEEFECLANPNSLIAERQHSGSPAPDSVREQVAELRVALSQFQAEGITLQQHIDEARQRCREYQV